MAAGRKPVWFAEDAHLLIKEYAKLTKTSMTETASQLVLQHLEDLEGGSAVAEAPAQSEAPKAAAPAPPKAKAAAKPSAPKKKRAPRSSDDGVEHIGGIWIV